jgi:hypothetical protein
MDTRIFVNLMKIYKILKVYFTIKLGRRKILNTRNQDRRKILNTRDQDKSFEQPLHFFMHFPIFNRL